ncbi:MAG TPA: hypothetical protein VN181_14945, partial [Thermoanaerobaculia bacterium]|nr:hypothetical protein [Thermoanaerobaculia bacterium]
MIRALILLLVASTGTAADFLPLKRGATWTYRAHVEWTDDENNVRSDTITWTSVVLSVHRHGERTAAVIEGLPLELAFYEPGQMRGYFVVSENERGVFLEGALSREEAEQIALESDDLTLLIAKPPVLGHCDDPGDCWRVEAPVPTSRGRGWRLAYRTNPDHQLITFVPGVGI